MDLTHITYVLQETSMLQEEKLFSTPLQYMIDYVFHISLLINSKPN